MENWFVFEPFTVISPSGMPRGIEIDDRDFVAALNLDGLTTG
jgi:hypothetical protein